MKIHINTKPNAYYYRDWYGIDERIFQPIYFYHTKVWLLFPPDKNAQMINTVVKHINQLMRILSSNK